MTKDLPLSLSLSIPLFLSLSLSLSPSLLFSPLSLTAKDPGGRTVSARLLTVAHLEEAGQRFRGASGANIYCNKIMCIISLSLYIYIERERERDTYSYTI